MGVFEVDRAERRFNCRNPRCGAIVWMPAEFGYSSDPYQSFDCGRCRSTYGLAGDGCGSAVPIELTTIQNEFTPSGGRRVPKPKRPEIYADPLLGPIRRAQDCAKRAENNLGVALAEAHAGGKSIRQIAQAVGMSTSAVHRAIHAVDLPTAEVIDHRVPAWSEGEAIF